MSNKPSGGPWDKALMFVAENLVKLGTEGVMSYLSVQLPFVNLPVVKQLVKFFVQKILDIAVMQTEMGAYMAIIDIKTSAEGNKYEKAGLELEEAKKKGDPDEVAKLEKEKMDAFRKLVRIKPY